MGGTQLVAREGDGMGGTYEDDGLLAADITLEAYMVTCGELRTGWIVEIPSRALALSVPSISYAGPMAQIATEPN